MKGWRWLALAPIAAPTALVSACTSGDDELFAADGGDAHVEAAKLGVDATDEQPLDPGLVPPSCGDAGAPAACGHLDLPDGSGFVDGSSILLPDGGMSPPTREKVCAAARSVVACGTSSQRIDDAAPGAGCYDLCCPNEYAVTCGIGPYNPPGVGSCREVGGTAAGGGVLACCPCL